MRTRAGIVCLALSMADGGRGRSMAPPFGNGSPDLAHGHMPMSADLSQGDPSTIAASLTGILQRLVAANLFPEHTVAPPDAGSGVPLSGLPFDVDARFFAGPNDSNFVRLRDSFSGNERWYTQGAIEAAGIGETIGRTWGTARWPASIPPPTNLSGDRHVSAAGEAIPVPAHVTGATFRLFRMPDGTGYVRVTNSAGGTVWLTAALFDS